MLVRQCLIFLCICVFTNSDSLASNPTAVQQYGHHVSIRVAGEHICSGSIIESRFILTLFSCISERSVDDDITVVAGTKSLDIFGDSYKIDKIIARSKYDDDIALLRTAKEIIFHDDIRKIPIASHKNYRDNYELTISSWEHPPKGEERKSDMLQQFSMRLYNEDTCKEKLDIDDYEFICISDPNGKEMCKLETGAAIVADGHQIGIFMEEEECFNAGEPYEHIPIHGSVEWIQNNTRVEKDTTSFSPVEDKKIEYDAPAGAHPYHVSIRHKDQHVCSGSIIKKRFILTSINCIMRFAPWTLTVMVGINSLNETGVIHQVKKVVEYPGYRYDIAIIKLATDITFNDRVNSIRIVKYSKKYEDSKNIILTGWQQEDSCGLSSDKLQQIPFHTIDVGKCKQLIPFLNSEYMCSMEEYSHTCNMDYGGPIVSNGVQIALNPFDVECGGKFQPHLHLPLNKVATWIKRNSRMGS